MSLWRCGNCTLDNPSSAVICEICGTKKEKQSHNIEKWKCNACTFENDAESLSCQMCQATNKKKKNHIHTEFIWEWRAKHRWHEYPEDISEKIEKAYFDGQLTMNLSLPHSEYVIDLTKLKQINKTSGKERNIQRVQYQYEQEEEHKNDDQDVVMDKPEVEQMDIDEINENVNHNVTDKSEDKWICPICTLENSISNTECEVCQHQRSSPTLPSKPSSSKPSQKKDLMNLSSDDESQKMEDTKPLKKQKKKKDVKPKPKPKPKQKQKEQTLLAMFDKDKNKNIPAPLTKLKKKRKRKLSDILDEEEKQSKQEQEKEEESQQNQAAKRKKLNDGSVKISKKYSEKHKGDSSVGSVLNKDLIDALWELSMIERNAGNRFKANAYSKACKALRTCGKKIASGKEAQELQGVGKKIAAKIDEILTTGHLQKLDKLRADDTVQAINELCQIHGIGPKKAAELVKEHKIFNIETLRKHCNLLNHQQQIGLKYFEYINKRIPREQCSKIGDIVEKVLHKIDSRIIMNICGSYRRGKKDCGDVDILITHPDKRYDIKKNSKQLLSEIVNKLKECNLLIEDLAHGPVKYMGICRYQEQIQQKKPTQEIIPENFSFIIPDNITDNDEVMITLNDGGHANDDKEEEEEEKEENGMKVYFRRLDIKFIVMKYYYANLLHFTGSDRFNVEMRVRANEKELILNENGLYKMLDPDDHSKKSKEPIIEPKSEKDIFDAIGMDFVEPHKRTW